MEALLGFSSLLCVILSVIFLFYCLIRKNNQVKIASWLILLSVALLSIALEFYLFGIIIATLSVFKILGDNNFKEIVLKKNKKTKNSKKKIQKDTIAKIEKKDKEFHKTSKYGYLQIDEQNKLFKIGRNVQAYEDLISFELVENGNILTKGGISPGRAIIGGALFGSEGAGLGSLSKIKKEDIEYCTNLSILVAVKNNKKGTFSIPFISFKTDKSKILYNQSITNAKATLVGFNYILDSFKDSAISEFDNLIKIKELLDLGIITPEEFDLKKKELIDL